MSEAIAYAKVALRPIETQQLGEGVMSYSDTAGLPSTERTARSEAQKSDSDGIGISFTGRIAGWSARHRWWVIAASIMVIVLAMFAANTVEMQTLDYEGEGDSAMGASLVSERFNADSAPTEQLLFSNPSLDANTPAYRAAVETLVLQLRALPEVAAVTSYYDTGVAAMLSEDGHVVLAQVVIAGDEDDADDKIDAILDTVRAAAANAGGFEIVMAGNTSIIRQVEKIDEEDFGTMMIVTMVLALTFMLIAFRGVVAAAIPLVMALGSIFTALGVAALVSHIYPMVDFLAQVVLLMGMAVGVDYSLFIVSRYRSERKSGRAKLEAIIFASNTTGRAVFYAGVVVLLSLAGLILTGSAIFISMAIAIIIVVLLALAASLTLLPALLAALGDNINRLRLPFIGREGNDSGGLWGAITDKVLARPLIMASVTGGALLVIAMPVFSLNLAFASGSDSLHDAVEAKRGLELLEEHFTSGLADPAFVIVDATDVNAPEVQAQVARLIASVEEDEAFFPPFET
ncbi:MAG: MMPL family transporter, partial [Chloroflexi bacterium]|nr:MMPL family transporter [Chloroflexota bacterium]